MLYIDDRMAYVEYKEYLDTSPKNLVVEGNIITTDDFIVEVEDKYRDILEYAQNLLPKVNIIENSGYKFKTY